MTHLHDVVDPAELSAALANKHVKVQTHPTLPYAIYNYTDACMWAGAWTATTMACRGLIVNMDTGQIIARPFTKFFNYGDPHTGDLDLSAPVQVTDKADGSLGVLFPTPGGHAVATRGSFTSWQAVHATKLWRDRYAGRVSVPDGVTLLFEVICPAGRIVVDYGDMDDLVLLGGIWNATGRTVDFDPAMIGWTGPTVEVMPHRTLADALAAEPRPDAEGMVVRFLHTDQRVKIKQADYLALHRILTGTNARTVWEFCAVNACRDLITEPLHWGSYLHLDPARAAEVLAAGPGWQDALVDGVPDEFHAWLRGLIDGFHAEVDRLRTDLETEVAWLIEQHGSDRKALAAAIRGHVHSGALFFLLDNQDITTYLWRSVMPDADRPWSDRSEDVA
ncbi:MAG TPA: RNA ligase [Mycobacteriales bacterium]